MPLFRGAWAECALLRWPRDNAASLAGSLDSNTSSILQTALQQEDEFRGEELREVAETCSSLRQCCYDNPLGVQFSVSLGNKTKHFFFSNVG